MKAQYSKYSNINLNRFREAKLEKYQLRKNIKLVTNDIKVALITTPTALLIGLPMDQTTLLPNCLYVISGCSLVYATTNLYLHKKEKQKRFTLRWAF